MVSIKENGLMWYIFYICEHRVELINRVGRFIRTMASIKPLCNAFKLHVKYKGNGNVGLLLRGSNQALEKLLH